jgi:hypothetical protein
VGGLLAALVPAARLVPAVRPEDMSQDPQVVQDYLSVRRDDGLVRMPTLWPVGVMLLPPACLRNQPTHGAPQTIADVALLRQGGSLLFRLC